MRIKRDQNKTAELEALKNNDNICPYNNTKCMCKEFIAKIDNRQAGKCPYGLYELIL